MKKIIFILLFAFVTSCTPLIQNSDLQKLSLGQTKVQVTKLIGNPKVVRGAIKNKYGQNIEVWEYQSGNPWSEFWWGAMASNRKDYWLYFLDGELARWGQAGDWQVESKNIYELRFSSGQNL